MTENELIKKAKLGDEKAFDELYEKYKHVMSHIAKKYYFSNGNNDDVVQEGMFGFLKAINTFDETKGNFGSYLRVLVNRQIINAMKKSIGEESTIDSLNVNGQGELETTEDTAVGIPSETPTPETSIIYEEEEKEFDEIVSAKLSDFERQVLQLRLSDFSYYDIMEKLEVSYKSVDNALSRIKSKLQHFFKKGE